MILRSFRSRILALVLGLVTVALSATVVAVVLKARAEVGREATEQLHSAADTGREVLRFRGNQLTSAAEVLAADFGFKEAVASGDTPTLMSAINNLRSRIGADLVIVLDPDGGVTSSTLAPLSARTRADLRDLVATDRDAQLVRLYRLIDGRPYQLVISPVLAPDPIAWTATGFALDDRVARDMARLLGVEVSFVTTAEGAAAFVASSRPASARAALLAAAAHAESEPFTDGSESDEWLTLTNPIRSANGPLTLVLQRSLSGALRPYQQLRGSILGIGAAVLAAALALAAWLARSATRPVDELTRAAERLEAGDHSAPVAATGTIEMTRLAGAFNAMRAAVADRELRILHQARHDAVTGLPNRARLTELLEEALVAMRRAGRALTVCIVELQQFKSIVGSLGHAAGDEVLRELGRRLSEGEARENRVARIGTDQFVVVLENTERLQAVRRAGELAELLRRPFEYSSVSLQFETRIGVAVFPDDGARAAELLQRADLGLYRAKESGAAVGSFVRGDDEAHRHRLAVLGDLRRAIEADELELYYQPKVALPSGHVVGCEALIRWRHPQKGFIPPNDFIPHAERTGLIRALTGWVIGTALRQQRRWQADGLNLDVAINVSPADLADAGFADALAVQLAQTGADAGRIVLEVTESGAMKDLAVTLRMMEQLRVLGVRFSIDDFGTGYSSLAHLRRLPVNEIKIDRSFVQELEARGSDDVIVRSTINLGHALGLKVVAEGVEVPLSWDTLARLGCDLVQGYFVAKPMPATEFDAWVRGRTAPVERAATARPAAQGTISARAVDRCPVGDHSPFERAQDPERAAAATAVAAPKRRR